MQSYFDSKCFRARFSIAFFNEINNHTTYFLIYKLNIHIPIKGTILLAVWLPLYAVGLSKFAFLWPNMQKILLYTDGVSIFYNGHFVSEIKNINSFEFINMPNKFVFVSYYKFYFKDGGCTSIPSFSRGSPSIVRKRIESVLGEGFDKTKSRT